MAHPEHRPRVTRTNGDEKTATSRDTAQPTAEEAARSITARVRQNWRITYPLIVASLSPVVLALADTAILGHHSTAALATVSLALPIYVFASSMIIPWGTATQTLTARWFGAEDHRQINRLLDTGLVFSVAIGLAATVALLAIAGPIVGLVSGGQPPPDSTVVLRILMLSLPFTAVTSHYRGVFGGLSQTGIAMRVALLVNLTNVPFTYLMVFTLDLGAVGSAIGTVVSTALGSLYIVVLGRMRLHGRYPFWRRANLAGGRKTLERLWRIGWPDTTFAGAAYAADILLVGFIAAMGAASLAGYRMLVATITILWVAVFSASSGIAILTGQRLGAGDLSGVAAFRRSGALLMGLLALLIVTPVLVAPSGYFGLFTSDTTVIEQARSASYLLAGIAPAMVLGMSLAGVLRGAGDTKGVMIAGLIGQLGFAVPVAWLFAVHLDHGLVGIYIGLLSGHIARATVTYLRFRGRRWQQTAERLD